MLTVGTQADTSREAVRVANAHEGVWATVGLHPNHTTAQEFVDESEEDTIAKVKTRTEVFDAEMYRPLAQDPKCVAIGECGLDFYRIPEHLDRTDVIRTQEEMLRRQFDLATELGKPVVIHCRDAHKEQADIIEEYVKKGKLGARGVIHCFTGTKEDALRYLALGFYISFSGVVTFPPRKEGSDPSGGQTPLAPLALVARDIPENRILIETDAPYLAPIPMRGKRNEPAYVRHTAEFLAKLRGVTLEEFAKVTTENTRRVFGI